MILQDFFLIKVQSSYLKLPKRFTFQKILKVSKVSIKVKLKAQ
jgi:hypothetical protein